MNDARNMAVQEEAFPFVSDVMHIEPCPRRVRAYFDGIAIADSEHALLMRERGHTPVYYFPERDVRLDLLQPSEHRTHCPHKGDARYWHISVGERSAENAVWCYREPVAGAPELGRHFAFYWDVMDAWFEEDDQVYVHPRDPYKRVDVLHSSRHVQVVLGGEVVADTRRPRLLFETGLPTRYYIPKVDVRLELLEPSETRTRCPYKGEARYYSVKIGGRDGGWRDIAWYYPYPVPECPKVENLVCFYDERFERERGDALRVDGEVLPRPRTPWS